MPLFANRYDYFEVLGQGGWGVVRRARDLHLDREVALKTYHTGTDLIVATYEAQRLTALESPHILRVFNADKYQDIPYIATEVSPLRSTHDHAAGLGVRPDVAVRWIRHALVGLDVCHRSNLLHRDIKPSNIFLQTEDFAKLGDFGISGVMDANGEAPAHGTWSIRAPEAFTQGVVTIRSDVYSTGLALYTLLTGLDPFFRAAVPDVAAAVVSNLYPSIRDLAPHVPRVIATRVERSMSLDPADRYPTAAAFHDELGLIRRLTALFAPIPPHSGHFRCWEGHSASRPIRVCVEQTHLGFAVEVRRITGGGTRLRDLCGTARNQQRLAIHLRRVFDAL